MKSLLIQDTTREERAQIVAESLGYIDSSCDGCAAGIVEMYEDYIEGRKELREVNMEFNTRYVRDVDMPKAYRFYGWKTADVAPIAKKYEAIRDPRHLYDLLSEIWCAYTCAPRMRDGWTKENMTLGQCSITAFLVQDIFGGEVYGILRPGGNYHCYNVVGDCVFDLTSEQFGEEVLCYEGNPVQTREVHFAKEEKRLRYEYLKAELGKVLHPSVNS